MTKDNINVLDLVQKKKDLLILNKTLSKYVLPKKYKNLIFPVLRHL